MLYLLRLQKATAVIKVNLLILRVTVLQSGNFMFCRGVSFH